MSDMVRISHPELLLFNNWNAPGNIVCESGKLLEWTSEELEVPTLQSCVVGFERIKHFNALQLGVHQEHVDFFPNTFRIDISNDGNVWEPIISEKEYQVGPGAVANWNFPLISARYIKLLFLTDKPGPNGKYFSAFGEFKARVSGIVSVEVSSELDRLWVKDNLFDERKDYGWSSSLRANREIEEIILDLGSINRVTEVRLLSKNDLETFFPEIFNVSYSEDNIAWHHLLEENGFLAEPGAWYRWRFLPTNIRFIKIQITEGARTREGKYISQIIEMELFAAPELLDKSSKQQQLLPQYASVLRSGIVRLAMDGEKREGLALQSSDRRLMEATTESKGRVELATDGEEAPGVVVQGNDRRLKYSTEDMPGIVRLARDEEVRKGHVVQSTDSRLRRATEDYPGIVELASDGENKPGAAVQGSDVRLRTATTRRPGIVRLAENGSDSANEVIQGNDRRLRKADVEQPGIVQLAKAGEETPEKVVQGNDPRLRVATTETHGIVRLANDGDSAAGVVVQGNDSRLKHSTTSEPGIVELATHGSEMEGRAVQASDPRLNDARTPLPHSHDFAPVEHSFDSHTGLISIEEKVGEPYNTLGYSPSKHAPITGVNRGGGAGLAGRGERDGVIGSGKEAGVVGFAPEEGIGILGASRTNAGGYFLSEKGYALVAGGEFAERGLFSSELAFLVRGRSRFLDTICLGDKNGDCAPAIAAYFQVDVKDVIVDGDVLVATADGKQCVRGREYGNPSIVGVVVDKASITLNHPELLAPEEPAGYHGEQPKTPQNMRLVAFSGIVKVRATAVKNPIKAGDLLVSSANIGRVEKLRDGNYRPGIVIGKSLEPLSGGEGVIKILLLGV